MNKYLLVLIVCLSSLTTAAAIEGLDPFYSESKPELTKGKPGVSQEMEAVIESAFTLDGRMPASLKKPDQRKLASALNDGFEFKVRQGPHVTAFWVKKNGDRFDLVFATNGGSRVTSTIPVEHYAQLTATASALRSPASVDLKKCKDSYVRLVVISEGKEAPPVTTCLESAGKQAEQIKRFGSALVTYVR